MDGAQGDLDTYKSGIFDDNLVLIQNRDEKFIRELNSELKNFVNN